MASKLRVAWIAAQPRALTGPATYAGAVATPLARLVDLQRLTPDEAARTPGRWDIVHFQDIKHVDPAMMRRLPGRKVVEIHDDYFLPPILDSPDRLLRVALSLQRRQRYRDVALAADAIIVHSRHMAARITRWLGREVINIPYPRPQGIAAGPTLEAREPLALFVGRDWYRKGLMALIDAWPLVLARIPAARLAVIGDEYFHSRIHHQRRARGLPVEFHRGMPNAEIMDWMRRARIVAMPSRQEAFGIVALEAAACATPLAVARAGGLTEFISDENTGRIIAPEDVAGWAGAIIEALEAGPQPRLRAQHALQQLAGRPDGEAVAERLAENFVLDVSRYHKTPFAIPAQ